MQEFPQWLVPLRDNVEWKKSFNVWVNEAIRIYSDRALMAAKNMEQLLGLRYAAGELRALQALVNYEDIEYERLSNNES